MHLLRSASYILLSLTASMASAETFVTWSTLGNTTDADNKPVYIQRFVVTGDTDIDALTFNQFARVMSPVDPADVLTEIVPGYYTVSSPRLTAGADSVVIDIATRGYLRSICYGPDGIHGVKNGRPVDVVLTREDITARPDMWRAPWGEDVMPYGDAVFAHNERVMATDSIGFYDVIPSFKSIEIGEGMTYIDDFCEVITDLGRPGMWRMTAKDGVITLEASAEDMPMAHQRMQALNIEYGDNIPEVTITDWPDFKYRGLMIDIARNYQSPESMEQIINLMATYGLNVLHFHFADDEAWRLEIPGLPELTSVGARRGYTTDEADYMAQIFAGNGDPDNPEGTANGYFTRQDFIDMLTHAASHGITVLPEVESPGHARAAIKAMEHRYRTTGDDTYCLIDRADTSVYTSAQSFHDNVMNPVLPGPVRFMTHVAGELQKMYREAGLEMPALHIGGDEVAKGAWTGSPLAREYMEANGMTNERLLHLKYITELLENLNEMGIPISGWQEIAVGHDEAYNEAVRPHVYSVNCWSTLGQQNSVTAQSARSGYPTVLSNVDHYYLDMCYTPHPYERGLSWGGYVSEYESLNGYPRQLCAVDDEAFANVIGISGQVFAETMRSEAMLQTFLLPKMLGLAERAWNADSTYTDAEFNSVICNRELPRWMINNNAWHVAQPGIRLGADGTTAEINTPYGPEGNFVIRYTLDGTNPTEESPLYEGPFAIGDAEQIRAVIFMTGNMKSVPSILYINN